MAKLFAETEAKAFQPADKSDVIGFLRRQEMRRHLAEMDDKKRNQLISQNRDRLDPDMALAIVEMPAAFSGVLESDRTMRHCRRHCKAMTDLRELAP